MKTTVGHDVVVPVVAELDVDHLRAGPGVNMEEYEILGWDRGRISRTFNSSRDDRMNESVYALCTLAHTEAKQWTERTMTVTLDGRVRDDGQAELRERRVQLQILAQDVLEVLIADVDDQPPRHTRTAVAEQVEHALG